MTAKKFTVTIEDLPRRRLLGNWMSLNAATDRNEYSQLKEAFARRLKAQPGCDKLPGYGICSNMRANLDCRFWTAIEAHPDCPPPNGMVSVFLEAGTYACLSAPEGTTLAEFYDYMRNFWEQDQTAYMIDPHRPCFEFFGQKWDGPSGLKICVPVKARYQQVNVDQPLPAALSA